MVPVSEKTLPSPRACPKQGRCLPGQQKFPGGSIEMVDNKLDLDEAQRAANYEAVKSAVRHDVRSEVAAHADRVADPAPAHIAGEMRERAVDEVVQTQREVERGRVAARVSQFVDYIFFLIYGLLSVRLLLELFAARESVAFFRFIRALTDPFYWPFKGLVPSLSTRDGFSLELSIVVALVVYGLLHMAINGLLRIGAHRKVEI
jgi:uncharacterized protein YggT (Ycf19 family)